MFLGKLIPKSVGLKLCYTHYSDVSAEDMSSDMSSETLERILNVTLSEPLLEGVFPTAPTSTLLMQYSEPVASGAVTSGAVTSGATLSSASSCNRALVDPNLKQQRLETNQSELFPSEHDIDNFLDQIHQ